MEPLDTNIIPVHKNFTNLGNNSTHTSLTNPLANSPRAFNNYTALGSDSNHSSLRTSGFQYVGGGAPIAYLTATGQSNSNVTDEAQILITKYIDEQFNPIDFLFNGFYFDEEPAPFTDELSVKITKFIDETFDSYDSGTSSQTIEDSANIRDEGFIRITKYIDEGFGPYDGDSIAYQYIDSIVTTKVEVWETNDVVTTVQSSIGEVFDVTTGIQTTTIPYNLIATTNASSLSNVFQPTIISGGITYVSNPATAPPIGDINANTNFIQWLDATVGNVSSCDITQLSMTLDYNGGTFVIGAPTPIVGSSDPKSAIGQSIDLFGFNGTVIDSGEELSTANYGYIVSGIFGNPLLNKTLDLLLYGNSTYQSILLSPDLKPANGNNYATVRDAATWIAYAAGSSLSFLATDNPIRDTISQLGVSGISALASLANQVGATLRWNGGTHYTIAYPNFFQGYWSVPSDSLLTSAGINYTYTKDLETGVSGTGLSLIPRLTFFDTGTRYLPGDLAGSPQAGSNSAVTTQPALQFVGSSRTVLTSDDPPEIFDLPLDYDEVYIQILLGENKATGGSNGLGIQNFVTTDKSQFFKFSDNAFASQYIYYSSIGGQYKPQVAIDYRLIPNNPSVLNGNFNLSIWCTTKSDQPSYNAAVNEALAREKDTVTRAVESIRYVKTYEGTINSYFFGSIPIPGMWGSATYCGRTVEGVIESVSFSPPGIIQVKVAQYTKINFLNEKVNI